MSTQEKTDSGNGNAFPNQNPLLISVVVDNILLQSEWSFKDFQNFRLVCKLWRDCSLSSWRSTATVCLLQERRPTSRKTGVLATSYSKTLIDDKDVFQLQEKPFLKYKLFNWEFGALSFTDFQQLWDTFGCKVRHLTLEKCTFHKIYPEHFMHMIYIGSPCLTHLVFNSTDCENRYKARLCSALKTACNPNIEHLEVIKLMPMAPIVRQGPVDGTLGFHAILQTFPDLKTLKMSELGKELYLHGDTPLTRYEVQLTWESAFFDYLKEEDLKNLRHLDLMHWNLSRISYDDLYKRLRRLKLPLETLCLTITGMSRPNDEFRKLVKAHLHTLRVLKIFVAPFYRPQKSRMSFASQEPSLIEELELWGNVTGDFDFLLGMPQLKKLRMNYDCFEKRKYIEETYAKEAFYKVNSHDLLKATFGNKTWRTDYVVMEHLTEFHVDLRLGEEEIKLFKKWMPNLRSFKSVFDSSTFPVLLREWRNGNLEEIHALYGSDLDDSDFVICGRGYPEDELYPNITWLKGLRHFTLETYCDRGRLTDKAAQQGFLKTNLVSLKICVSSKFSSVMEERLKESINHVEVIRNYGRRSHKGECCARLDFKKRALIPRVIPEGLDRREYHKLKGADLVEVGIFGRS